MFLDYFYACHPVVLIKIMKESITFKQTGVYNILYFGNMFRCNVVTFRTII